jgi:hypothetical protein
MRLGIKNVIRANHLIRLSISSATDPWSFVTDKVSVNLVISLVIFDR